MHGQFGRSVPRFRRREAGAALRDRARTGDPTAPAVGPAARRRDAILAVDDGEERLRALTDALQGGFRVAAHSTTKGALDALDADPSIAAILVSEGVAKAGGGGFLGAARERSLAPCILLMETDDFDTLARAVNAGGIFACIRCPWDAEELRETVARAVERQARERLAAEEWSLLDGLMHSMPDAVYFKDTAHRYIRANRAVADRFGADDSAEVIGRSDFDFLPDEIAERVRKREREILATGRAATNLIGELVDRDGEVSWYSTTKAPMFDEAGRPVGLVGVSRDITAQRRAERERDLLFEVVRALFHADGFDEAIGLVLRLVCEHTGWDYGEAWQWDPDAQTMQLVPVFHASTDRQREFWAATRDGGYHAPGMPRRVQTANEPEWIPDLAEVDEDRYARKAPAELAGLTSVFAVPVPGRSGAPVAVLAFFMARQRAIDDDHVELVGAIARHLGQYLESTQAWEAARKHEQLLQTIFDNQTELLTRLKPDGTRVFANPALPRFMGLSREEYERRTMWENEHRDSHETIRRVLATLSRDAPEQTYITRMLRHDGEWRSIEWISRGIFDEEGELLEVQSVGRDVTDRLNAEEAAAVAHKRLLDAIEALPLGFALYDSEERLVVCNETYRNDRPEHLREMIRPGLALEDLFRGMAAAGQFAGTVGEQEFDDVEALVAIRLERWRNRPSRWEQRSAEGKWREIVELPTSEGGTVVLRTDITERKRNEQALAESESRLRSILDNAVDIILLCDINGDIVDANAAAERMLGFDREELLSMNVFGIEQISTFESMREKWSEGVAGVSLRGRYRRKDGTEFPTDVHTGRFMTADGPLFVVLVRDMSEWERLLDEMARNEERFRSLIANAAQGFFVQRDLKPLYANQAFLDLLGYENEEEYLALDNTMDFVHPDHREEVTAMYEARVGRREGEAPAVYETRYIRRDGTPVSLEARAVVVHWDGEPAVSISLTDLSEIRRQQERFRSLIANAVHGFFVHRDFKPLYANRALLDLLGYDSEEEFLALGDVQKIMHPDEREGLVAMYEARVGRREGDAPAVYETRYLKRDGSPILIEVRAAVVPWDDGWALSVSMTDISERKRQEERFRTLIMHSAQAVMVHRDFHPLFVNQAMADILGYDGPEEVMALGDLRRVFDPEELPRLQAFSDARAMDREAPGLYETRLQKRDGGVAIVETRVAVVPWDDGQAIAASMIDVTDRRATERQLQQAQKMEAVGQLTGGIAHDFNNLLTVIIGNLDLLSRRLAREDDEKLRKWASNAGQAAQRGADLTRRLLAFSRRQVLAPVVLDVNETIADMLEMLARVIGEHIELDAQLGENVGAIRADPGQLESAVLNLAVNARDAMPDGGSLTIETDSIRINGERDAFSRQLEPGAYVRISVSDSGAGMTREVLEKVFEPFFTTKETGKGTGLGLSMVFGFAKQSGGDVTIYSEPGYGTTVRLYFPQVAGDDVGAIDALMDDGRPIEGAVVLIAEDDEGVRETAVAMLENLGCRVIAATSGPEALELLRAHPEVDLLFTDVVMPGGMTGIDLARTALDEHPRLRVLLTSGYAEEALRRSGGIDIDIQWLPKPYTATSLAEKLSAALGKENGDDG